jgi:hypothetical protein
MGMPIVASGLLTAGLRSNFNDYYNQGVAEGAGIVDSVMDPDIPSDTETELFAYLETSPYPVLWRKGESISSKNVVAQTFSVTNRSWGRALEWNEDDRRFDKVGGIMKASQKLGEHWGTLKLRVLTQIVQATTDADLLPAIPNAAGEGVALFSATNAAGGARYGISGGNIVTGTGVASGSAIVNDFYLAIARAKNFQDTEGQPLHSDGTFDKEIIVLASATNEIVFRQAFAQNPQANAAPGTAQSAVQNLIFAAGYKVKVFNTQRVTGNDWYVIFSGASYRIAFRTMANTPRELTYFMDNNNSDFVRKTKQEGMQWDSREGYGVGAGYAAVKVDN